MTLALDRIPATIGHLPVRAKYTGADLHDYADSIAAFWSRAWPAPPAWATDWDGPDEVSLVYVRTQRMSCRVGGSTVASPMWLRVFQWNVLDGAGNVRVDPPSIALDTYGDGNTPWDCDEDEDAFNIAFDLQPGLALLRELAVVLGDQPAVHLNTKTLEVAR